MYLEYILVCVCLIEFMRCSKKEFGIWQGKKSEAEASPSPEGCENACKCDHLMESWEELIVRGVFPLESFVTFERKGERLGR